MPLLTRKRKNLNRLTDDSTQASTVQSFSNNYNESDDEISKNLNEISSTATNMSIENGRNASNIVHRSSSRMKPLQSSMNNHNLLISKEIMSDNDNEYENDGSDNDDDDDHGNDSDDIDDSNISIRRKRRKTLKLNDENNDDTMTTTTITPVVDVTNFDQLFERRQDDDDHSMLMDKNFHVIKDGDNNDENNDLVNINADDIIQNIDNRMTNEYDTQTASINRNGKNDNNDAGVSQNHCSSSYQNTLTANIQTNTMSKQYDLKYGEIGHIREITLKNFMCHKNFHLKFGPRINFIVGQNGSGKSAILIGIVLGFGGRASTTNRGSDLSLFIKNGESRAQIIIKIANSNNNTANVHRQQQQTQRSRQTQINDNINNSSNDDDSYRYDQYGSTIIIERIININGSSNYKLKSESGKIISERREELDNILQHFQIVIDNPICILTQEISKNFLNTKNAHEKFKFFIKATEIEKTKQFYEDCYDNRRKTQQTIMEKTEQLKLYKNEYEKYQQQIDIIDLLRNNAQLMRKLHHEILWSSINECRHELENNRQEYENLIQNIGENKSKLIEYRRKNDDFVKNIEENNKKLENFTATLKELQSTYNESKIQSDQIRNRLIQKESDMNIIRKEMNSYVNEINSINEKIEGIEERNSQLLNDDDGDGEFIGQNFAERIERLKRELNEKHSKQKDLKSQLANLKQEKDSLLMDRKQCDEKLRSTQIQLNVCQQNLKRLQNSTQNRLDYYGRKYSELQMKINENLQKFHCKPFGPIGEYINLKNCSTDAYAVECFLKKFIYSYVVDNSHDANILKALIDRTFQSNPNNSQSANDHMIKPTIIIRKYTKLHDVTHTQATSPKYQNFLQLLNIKSPERDPVANCLIDHLKIEQILYIPNFNEAQRLLSHRELVPKNCIRAYTADGDVMFPSTNRSDFKCYPNRAAQRPQGKMVRILIENKTNIIENYKKQITELRLSQEQIVQNSNELLKKMEECKKSIALNTYQIQQNEIEIHQMDSKLIELQEKAAIKPIEALALKEEVQKLEQDHKKLEEQLSELRSEREQLKIEYNKYLSESEMKQKQYRLQLESRDPLQDEIERTRNEQLRLMNEIDKIENELKIFEEKRLRLQKDIDDMTRKINEEETKALEKTGGQPITTTRKRNEIQKEINQIELKLRTNEHLLDEQKQLEIRTAYEELKKSIETVDKEMVVLKKFFHNLNQAIVQRKQAYLMMRTFIERTVNLHFQEFLKQKQFKGYINVTFNQPANIDDDGSANNRTNRRNNRAKTLELVIKPNNVQSQSNNDSQTLQSNYTNTKSLSGGERSFSTVAFIIALWQLCQSPFRILDEIDVFMDMTTRKISLDSLVEFASQKSTKQFIFLSPLSLQEFEHKDLIQIFQMPEPER